MDIHELSSLLCKRRALGNDWMCGLDDPHPRSLSQINLYFQGYSGVDDKTVKAETEAVKKSLTNFFQAKGFAVANSGTAAGCRSGRVPSVWLTFTTPYMAAAAYNIMRNNGITLG